MIYEVKDKDIQVALDYAEPYGGSVYIPADEYDCEPLLYGSGITVYGDGPFTVLKAKNEIGIPGQIGAHLLKPKAYNTGTTTGAVFRDLKLIGNSANQNLGGPITNASATRHGLALHNCEHCTVERVTAEDFDGDGIYLGRYISPNTAVTGSQHNLISNCTVSNNVRNGMMIGAGNYNTISDCYFEANQRGMVPEDPKYKPAMYASAELDMEPNVGTETCNYNLITRNHFVKGNFNGIQLTRPHNQEYGNRILNNWFVDTLRGSQLNVTGQGVQNLSVKGNVFVFTTPDGKKRHLRVFNGASDIRVDGNDFIGGVADGGGEVIQFDTGGISLARPTFRRNFVDLTGGTGTGCKARFYKGITEPDIGDNTLLAAVLQNDN